MHCTLRERFPLRRKVPNTQLRAAFDGLPPKTTVMISVPDHESQEDRRPAGRQPIRHGERALTYTTPLRGALGPRAEPSVRQTAKLSIGGWTGVR